jgi:hypothetical protein
VWWSLSNINNHEYDLGRNSDPRKIEDIGSFKLFTKKAVWETLSIPGMRRMVGMMFPKTTINHVIDILTNNQTFSITSM